MDESSLDRLAKQTGFCKRKRKLTPRYFLEMLLCKAYESRHQSLTDHALMLQRNRGMSVSKQSIHSRFTGSAVRFVRQVLDEQLKCRPLLNNTTIFKPFSKVFVQDATKFSLPSHLQKDYPGYGGCAPNSGGQVQFTYELNNQQIYQADLYAATRNECLSATANSWIEQGALILRDLGYFSIEGFKEIIAKGAYVRYLHGLKLMAIGSSQVTFIPQPLDEYFIIKLVTRSPLNTTISIKPLQIIRNPAHKHAS